MYLFLFSCHVIIKLTAKVSPLKFFLLKPSFLLSLHNFTKILTTPNMHVTPTRSKQHHIRSFPNHNLYLVFFPRTHFSRTSFHINTSHDSNSCVRILGFSFFFSFFSHARILSTLSLHMHTSHVSKKTKKTRVRFLDLTFFFHLTVSHALIYHIHTSHVFKNTSSIPRYYYYYFFVFFNIFIYLCLLLMHLFYIQIIKFINHANKFRFF